VASTPGPNGQSGGGNHGSASGGTTAAESSAPAPGVPHTADNSITGFGTEASDADRAAALAVVKGFLMARAGAHWAKACSYLSSEARHGILSLGPQIAPRNPRAATDCGVVLQGLSVGLPSIARVAGTTTRLASLRVSGDDGYAIYRAHDGRWSFIPLIREGGAWKVPALAGSELR
jgi:hypothetical protein